MPSTFPEWILLLAGWLNVSPTPRAKYGWREEIKKRNCNSDKLKRKNGKEFCGFTEVMVHTVWILQSTPANYSAFYPPKFKLSLGLNLDAGATLKAGSSAHTYGGWMWPFNFELPVFCYSVSQSSGFTMPLRHSLHGGDEVVHGPSKSLMRYWAQSSHKPLEVWEAQRLPHSSGMYSTHSLCTQSTPLVLCQPDPCIWVQGWEMLLVPSYLCIHTIGTILLLIIQILNSV